VAAVLYALIALVPVVFYRGVSEVFEFPKTELLATGALVLLGALLAREIARARGEGWRTWARGVGSRIAGEARRDPLGGAIALFVFSSFLSALFSIRRDASFFGAHESEAGFKTALATAIVYFTSRSLALGPRHLHRLARAAAFALAVALFYAALQLLGLDPFPWTRSATIAGVRRVPGTLGHANHLGAYIAMTLPLLAWLAADSRGRRSRLFWIALAAASLPALAATLSRGAWVACGMGTLVFGLLAWRARAKTASGGRRLVLAAAALALAAFLIPLATPFRPELLLRLRQITDTSAPSTQSRVHLWRAGIAMTADRPVLGVGTDGYLAAFPRYRTPAYWNIEWNGLSAKAHDELIQIAATQGFLGLVAALLVFFFTVRAVLHVSRHRDPGIRVGAAAAGGALLAFAVLGTVGFTVASTGVLAAALAGWAAGTRASTPDAHAPSPDRASRAIAAAAVAVLWGVLVLLPWLAEMNTAAAMRQRLASPERAERLRRALTVAPWDARYASELGRALLAHAYSEADPPRRSAGLAQARAAFERAVRLSPFSGELHALLARTIASQAAGTLPLREEALIRAEYDRAMALEPTNANVLELATQGYLEMGRMAEARAVALRCTRLFPDYALPIADLGVVALLEGRTQAAADTLTLALRRNWHGEEGAAMAAKSNYVAALREMRLGDVLKKK
jgi:O-antigen ligase